MRIEDLMCRDVYHCRPEDSLESAARLMWEHDCGCAPVCSGDGEQRVVGMITDRDISMCALFEGKPLAALRVQDAMSRDVSSCGPDEESKQVEQIMTERQVRRVPVVNAEGNLLGILSLADLVRQTGPGSPRTSGRVTESEIGKTLAGICVRRSRAEVPTLASALQDDPAIRL